MTTLRSRDTVVARVLALRAWPAAHAQTAACGGNVSKAARLLGVSRGLVYRHLKSAAQKA